MAADIERGREGGISGVDLVLIRMWTLTLEGPRTLPDPLAFDAVDQVADALAPFLADLRAALSTACGAPLVLRAED